MVRVCMRPDSFESMELIVANMQVGEGRLPCTSLGEQISILHCQQIKRISTDMNIPHPRSYPRFEGPDQAAWQGAIYQQ